ncbi:MAG TPA: histidine--tRNA ligase [Bacillota bacterium]|nr:histidine--tRNA ligase [Bacillota bacterium]
MSLVRPRGTTDVLPPRSERWRSREERFREVCRLFGYPEILLPLFEHAELFQHTVGETSDIVVKELYSFSDRSGRLLALRPEGTAPAARAYLENGLHKGPQPVKLAYIGPMFRYERPQSGRYRQHTQMGIELFGAPEPGADVEVISLAVEYLRRESIADLTVRLNSIGCPVCRPAYRDALRAFIDPILPELCEDCRARQGRNPLRILDCKVETCRQALSGAPRTLDGLCDQCREHFGAVRRQLSVLGLPLEIDSSLVRGLDYYTRTVFELVHREAGSQHALCGGGRYDGLVEILGGPPTPGVGFGMGLERVLDLTERFGDGTPSAYRPELFLAVAGEEVRDQALTLVAGARCAGVATTIDFGARSLKSQLKNASRLGAAFSLVLGQREIEAGMGCLRDMGDGSEYPVALDRLVETVRQLAGRKD